MLGCIIMSQLLINYCSCNASTLSMVKNSRFSISRVCLSSGIIWYCMMYEDIPKSMYSFWHGYLLVSRWNIHNKVIFNKLNRFLTAFSGYLYDNDYMLVNSPMFMRSFQFLYILLDCTYPSWFYLASHVLNHMLLITSNQ